MTIAYLGLGANLGDPAGNIRRAIKLLNATPGIRVLRTAGFYETEPVGYANQPWFINTVTELETSLSPADLLSICLHIERQLGRQRTAERNGPRSIDLDILLYGEQCQNEDGLVIPHPRLAERLFVLAPLAELVPEFIHPVSGQRMDELTQTAYRKAAKEGCGAVLRMVTRDGA
jgi:2-amino-4-hydroxy-6-hydroxymethyldihydropteridine diphosphokinase